jgi:hypothetical protein
MADPKHLEILKQGADAWNSWINKNVHIRPDLRNADLRGINLTGCYLAESELYGADLSEQDLTGLSLYESNLTETKFNRTILTKADFTGARLYRADLIEAILEGANLQATDFRDANLRRANLRETYLGGAIFTGANLYDADLNGAKLNGTTFGDNDLSVVHSLDKVTHGGASIIGISTIYNSQGKIPVVFLRGCGVPEEFITYMHSLVREPIQFYSCFISYSSKDQDFVNRLYSDLQNFGIRCWFAPSDLKIGDSFRDRIDESIKLHDKLLLILSKDSINSSWVEKEAEIAIEREQLQHRTVLFPIRLDNTVMDFNNDWLTLIRNTRQIGDFTDWQDEKNYQKALSKLVRDLTLNIAAESKNPGRAK